LCQIPIGETRTYGELANMIGAPRAVRAVASSCARNPVSLAVPCHRVVGSDGDLTGYRWGVPRKRALLARERALAETGHRSATDDDAAAGFVASTLFLTACIAPITMSFAFCLGGSVIIADSGATLGFASLLARIPAILLGPVLMARGVTIGRLDNHLAHRWRGGNKSGESDCVAGSHIRPPFW